MRQSDAPHDGMLSNCALYLLGALDPAAEKTFERHLAGCAECRRECERLGPAASGLAGLDSRDLSAPPRPGGDGGAG
jgi:anti-sigma factor RsiW